MAFGTAPALISSTRSAPKAATKHASCSGLIEDGTAAGSTPRFTKASTCALESSNPAVVGSLVGLVALVVLVSSGDVATGSGGTLLRSIETEPPKSSGLTPYGSTAMKMVMITNKITKITPNVTKTCCIVFFIIVFF